MPRKKVDHLQQKTVKFYVSHIIHVDVPFVNVDDILRSIKCLKSLILYSGCNLQNFQFDRLLLVWRKEFNQSYISFIIILY